MPAPPTGTVTLLFTDIEGSTRLLHELGPEAYAEELAAHRRVLRTAFDRYGGVEMDTQGDAFFVAFARAPSAVEAAQSIKAGLSSGLIRVRIGLHTGTPLVTEEGYVGNDVHQARAYRGRGARWPDRVVPDDRRARAGEVFARSARDTPAEGLRRTRFALPTRRRRVPASQDDCQYQPADTGLELPRERTRALRGKPDDRDDASAHRHWPGGAGKTRFALELARRVREERFVDYRDGVFFVPLAALRDPALVLDTVAESIGAKVGLREDIADKQMLLLLDNFEQVVAAASELSELLEACSNLSLLVTSREVLHIRGEVEYQLPALAEADGVLLFCERAQQEPSADIRELCQRLDGLPLAIELAAARARMLSPAEMLARLSQRLDLLKGGRDADPRQQTLRATIEWSHDLLSGEERQVFRRLAVFAGRWTLESAIDVVDTDLDTLQSLFDKSLLRRSEDNRFFLLETIREYARERLEESGELEAVSREHARFMLRCAQDALDEAERWDGARKLEPERENLRTAMRWTLDAGEAKTSLVLATAYSILCVYRGPFGEGRSWLAAALQADGEHALAERVQALLAAAGLADRQRDLEPAREFAQAGLSLARSIDDPTSVIRALVGLGVIGGVEGDYRKAESTLRDALAFASRAGDERNVREALAMLGWVALARQDYTQARAVIGEGLELSRRAGDARGIFYGTGNLGHVAAREGCFEEALQLFRESLLIGRQQDLQSEADGLQEVAAVAAGQRRYEEAAVLLGAAEGVREGIEAEQEAVARGLREETLSILRRNLEEDHFAAAGERGRQMTLEQAVEYAVQFIDSTSS